MTAFDLELGLSSREYASFYAQALRRLSQTSGHRGVWPAVLSFAALLSFAVLQRLGLDGKSALAVFCAFAAGMLVRHGLRCLQNRAIRGSLFYPDSVFLARRRMRFTEQGVAFGAAAYGSHFAWAAVHEVTASVALVILWIEPVAACIISVNNFGQRIQRRSGNAKFHRLRRQADRDGAAKRAAMSSGGTRLKSLVSRLRIALTFAAGSDAIRRR